MTDQFAGRRWASGLLAAAVSACALTGGAAAFGGIDAESNTDGFNPAAQLYGIAEAGRLSRVTRQLELNRFLIYSTYYEPGDRWGPPLGGPPIRQPIGYESKQIGPNRWMYRPLYAEDVAAGTPTELRSPGGEPLRTPHVQPQLPAPSDAAPDDFIPPRDKPAGPDSGGPRAF